LTKSIHTQQIVVLRHFVVNTAKNITEFTRCDHQFTTSRLHVWDA